MLPANGSENGPLNGETPGAEGARWAAEHADAFLLVADREALAGPEKGAARSGIQLLARRLGGRAWREARPRSSGARRTSRSRKRWKRQCEALC